MSIQFTAAAARPTIKRAGRPKADNPYADVAAHLASDLDATVEFHVPMVEGKTAEQSVEFAIRKIREAGAENGVTIRTVVDNETGAVTAWAVKQIKRARKTEK